MARNDSAYSQHVVDGDHKKDEQEARRNPVTWRHARRSSCVTAVRVAARVTKFDTTAVLFYCVTVVCHREKATRTSEGRFAVVNKFGEGDTVFIFLEYKTPVGLIIHLLAVSAIRRRWGIWFTRWEVFRFTL